MEFALTEILTGLLDYNLMVAAQPPEWLVKFNVNSLKGFLFVERESNTGEGI